MKKISLVMVISFLCVLLMAVGAFAGSEPAIIDSGDCGENLSWTLDANGLLTISGKGEMKDYRHGASPFYKLCKDIKEVKFSEDITSIGACAFEDCEGLSSITIPIGVKKIGECAFLGCDGITDIYCNGKMAALPFIFGEVQKLSNLLERITIHYAVSANKCGDNVSWEIEDGDTLVISGNGPIDDSPMSGFAPDYFYYQKQIKNIIINEGVTGIGSSAFYSLINLQNVSIPSTVTSIKDGAFAYCKNLKKVFLPEGLRSIGEGAFLYCEKIDTLYIPSTVKSIGKGGLLGCSKLSNIVIFPGVKIQDNKSAVWGRNSANIYYVGTNEQFNSDRSNYALFWNYAVVHNNIYVGDVKSISISKMPAKLVYVKGTPIDLSGALISVKAGNNYEAETIVTYDMISGYDANVCTDQTITVSYKGMTTTFDVKVIDGVAAQ